MNNQEIYVFVCFTRDGEFRKFDTHSGALGYAQSHGGIIQKFLRNRADHEINLVAKALGN